MSAVILGIDIGLANTGYGVIRRENSRYEKLDYGNIRTTPKTPSEVRLKIIYDALSQSVTEHQPSAVVIEEVFFSKNVTSAIGVSEARGVAKLVAANNELPVFDYKPDFIKMAIVGYGRATKNQIQEMVKVILGLEQIPKPNHAADALAIAICHARSMKI